MSGCREATLKKATYVPGNERVLNLTVATARPHCATAEPKSKCFGDANSLFASVELTHAGTPFAECETSPFRVFDYP